MTTPVDAFISDLSIMITEASTTFPMSKIIYSTLLPRAHLPSHLIGKINKQIADGCSKLPNVHIVTHENLLAKGSVVLHDDRHIKKRHLGLFAANMTDAIRGRAKPTRSLTNHLFRSPHRSQSPPPRKYSSYSDAVRKFMFNALFSVTSSSTGLQLYYKLAIACSS